MGILQLISTSNFITVNKDLIKELGLEEAILLGELASEYDYWNNKNEIEDDYFYSTIENIEEKTTLTAYKQRKCLENLKNKGIIDIQIRGIPAKRYIKINEEKVIEIFNNKLLKNLTTGCKKISQLEVKKLNGNNNNINNNINNISSFNENDEELKKHFELIWDKYPNKTGKTKSKEYFYQWIKGKRISKETIKLTDKQMYYAVSKYAKECEEKGIEQQYIKHGDTFFNKAILDYVEADNE